jgi:hypothetical protein
MCPKLAVSGHPGVLPECTEVGRLGTGRGSAIFNPKEMFSTDILIAHFDVRTYQSHLCKMLDLKIKEGIKSHENSVHSQ